MNEKSVWMVECLIAYGDRTWGVAAVRVQAQVAWYARNRGRQLIEAHLEDSDEDIVLIADYSLTNEGDLFAEEDVYTELEEVWFQL